MVETVWDAGAMDGSIQQKSESVFLRYRLAMLRIHHQQCENGQHAWGLIGQTLYLVFLAKQRQSPAVLVDRKVNGGWEGRMRSNALTGYPTDHR